LPVGEPIAGLDAEFVGAIRWGPSRTSCVAQWRWPSSTDRPRCGSRLGWPRRRAWLRRDDVRTGDAGLVTSMLRAAARRSRGHGDPAHGGRARSGLRRGTISSAPDRQQDRTGGRCSCARGGPDVVRTPERVITVDVAQALSAIEWVGGRHERTAWLDRARRREHVVGPTSYVAGRLRLHRWRRAPSGANR
jgi:hypothetical protein